MPSVIKNTFCALACVALLSSTTHAQTAKPLPKPPIKSASTPSAAEKPKEEIPPSLINWKTSYADALAEAKRTDKPIMVDFSGANCGWCRIKEKYIDADPVIAKYVNSNFISVKGANDLGAVKTNFKPTGTPHTLLLSHDGEKLLVRIKGYNRPNEFMNELYDAVELEKGYLKTPEIADKYSEVVAIASNDLPQAVALLDQAIAINPNISVFYVSRAWRQVFLGKPEAAIKDYLKAKELAPHDPQPPFDLAKVYLSMGKFSQALTELQAARKLTPRSPFYIGIYEVVALARAGRKRESEELLKTLGSMSRDSAYGYSYPQAIITTIARGDYSKIDEYASKISAGDRAMFCWVAGNLFATRGDKANAITYLQKAFDNKYPLLWASHLAAADLKALGSTPPPRPAPKAKPPAEPKPAEAAEPEADAKAAP